MMNHMSNCYNHPNVYVGMIPKSNNLQNNQFHQSIVYKAKLCTGREIGYWLGEEGYCDDKFSMIDFYDDNTSVHLYGRSYYPRYGYEPIYICPEICNILDANPEYKFIRYSMYRYCPIYKERREVICIRTIRNKPIKYRK